MRSNKIDLIFNDKFALFLKDFEQHINQLFEDSGEAITTILNIINSILKILEENFHNKDGKLQLLNENFKELVDELYKISWEKLHSGIWSDVEFVWRELFAFSCLLLAINYFCYIYEKLDENERNLILNKNWQNCFYFSDMGLIMGGPDTLSAHEIQNILTVLNDIEEYDKKKNNDYKKTKTTGFITNKKIRLDKSILTQNDPKFSKDVLSIPIDSKKDLSLIAFEENYYNNQKPVILKGAMKSVPAYKKWQDFEIFHEKLGRRTIPVEIGSSYTDEHWTQKLMTFSDFIDKYIKVESPPEIGYLAQHPIFDQIPELSKDIHPPDYVYCTSNDHEDDEYLPPLQMIWFGPKGTITPLHTDNYNNIFTQIVGEKYVRLYSPNQTKHIYPFKEGPLTNTSQIKTDLHTMCEEEIEQINTQFPKFLSQPYYEAHLEAGDGLFIPHKWWHFVKSLTPNISISFWYN